MGIFLEDMGIFKIYLNLYPNIPIISKIEDTGIFLEDMGIILEDTGIKYKKFQDIISEKIL